MNVCEHTSKRVRNFLDLALNEVHPLMNISDIERTVIENIKGMLLNSYKFKGLFKMICHIDKSLTKFFDVKSFKYEIKKLEDYTNPSGDLFNSVVQKQRKYNSATGFGNITILHLLLKVKLQPEVLLKLTCKSLRTSTSNEGFLVIDTQTPFKNSYPLQIAYDCFTQLLYCHFRSGCSSSNECYLF